MFILDVYGYEIILWGRTYHGNRGGMNALVHEAFKVILDGRDTVKGPKVIITCFFNTAFSPS